MEKLLIIQLIAHLLADFFFQTENLSRGKQRQGLSSWHIWAHSGIVLLVSLLLTLTCEFILYAVAITILHLLIDYLKGLTDRLMIRKQIAKQDTQRNTQQQLLFFADQLLHLVVIYWIVKLYFERTGVMPGYLDLFSINQLLFVFGFLFCLKPANIIIRICLSSLNLPVLKNESQTSEKQPEEEIRRGLEKAGRWIGSFERILALLLVLSQQYTAIGFIITAKSILRFSDKELYKTEYVLVGTLMSFGIAIMIGIALQSGYMEVLLKNMCS